MARQRRHRIQQFRTAVVHKEAMQNFNQIVQSRGVRFVAFPDHHAGLFLGLAANTPTSAGRQHKASPLDPPGDGGPGRTALSGLPPRSIPNACATANVMAWACEDSRALPILPAMRTLTRKPPVLVLPMVNSWVSACSRRRMAS